jgi:fibronectin type 3 domain-containing protein
MTYRMKVIAALCVMLCALFAQTLISADSGGVPAAVSDLADAPTATVLYWSASPRATSYNIYRANSSVGPFTLIGNMPSDGNPTEVYQDFSTTLGTTYYYAVTAMNSSGESALSNIAVATRGSGPATPILIQKATFSLQPSSSETVNLTLPQPTKAGDALIVGVSFWPLDLTAVTDGSGDVFTRGLTNPSFHNVSGSGLYTNFYYANAITGGTTSLTLHFSGGQTYALVALSEVTGLHPDFPVDQSAYHESVVPTTAWSSGSVTTSSFNEYLFAWAATDASSPMCSNPPAGWKVQSQTVDTVGGATVCLVDSNNLSNSNTYNTGTYQAFLTAGAPQNYAMEIVALRMPGPAPAPAGLTTTAGEQQLTLSWNPVPGATKYDIFVNNIGSNYNQINLSPVTTTSYTVTGLTDGARYCYEVTVLDAYGDGIPAGPICAAPGPAGLPPTTPTGLTVTPGNGLVQTNWNPVSGALDYNLYMSVSGGPYNSLSLGIGTNGSVSGLTNGTQYCFEVTAINGWGESQRSAPVCAVPQGPPLTPTGLTASPGDGQVILTWNPSNTATSYTLYRNTAGGALTSLASVSTTSYTNEGLADGTRYCYEVSAANALGVSKISDPVCTTPQPALAISLVQKAVFSRQPTAASSITLNLVQPTGAGNTFIVGVSFWPVDLNSITDNSGDTFRRGLPSSIFHDMSGGAEYTNFFYATNIAGGATTLTLNFTAARTYMQAVVAEVKGLDPSAPFDQAGYQESLTAATPWSSANVTTTTPDEYLFSWAATQTAQPTCSSPASGWSVEIQENAFGATICLLDQIVSTQGTYRAAVVPSSAVDYGMEIVAFKAGVQISGPPATPTGLTALPGDTKVSLSWNSANGATGYNLYRSVSGSAFNKLNTSVITVPNYVDLLLINNTRYCYEATAVNSSGESAKSNAACATPEPAGPAAISLIQKATFSKQGFTGGTVTLTLPQSTTAGHTLIVGVSFWPLDVSSVSDSSGDVFTRGLPTSLIHDVPGSSHYTNFYYAKSTSGGANSLTLNFTTTSIEYALVAVAEVSGLDSVAPLDASIYQESFNATSAWVGGSLTAASPNEYLFSWGATMAAAPVCSGAAGGWTLETQTNDTANGATVCLLDQIVSATGGYQASVLANPAEHYAMETMGFKAAEGAK